MNRRGFIAGAAATPLFAIPLITSVQAAPPAFKLLEGYNEWLFYERRLLALEMYPGHPDPEACVPMTGLGRGWHFRNTFPQLWSDLPQPSTRAALVMRLVGAIGDDGSDWNPQRRSSQQE